MRVSGVAGGQKLLHIEVSKQTKNFIATSRSQKKGLECRRSKEQQCVGDGV